MKTKEFLEFLEDEKVQDKIKDIVSNGSNISNNSEDELESIKKERDEAMKIISDLKEKYQKLQKCLSAEEDKVVVLNNDIKTQAKQTKVLKSDVDSANEKLNFYRQNFEEELKIYEKFVSLDSGTKESLSNIFKGDTLSDFISCGVQEKNIHNLWEYTKNEILENRNQDISALIEIFYFFFKRCQVSYDIYQLSSTKVDDSFDTQKHLKHNESISSSGSISKVYLQGYKNIKTDKTIKQSVVKIG